MARQEKLFLTKNIMPVFDRLLDLLDTVPGELRSRSAGPFFYAGLATRYEDERLTEDDRDNLPERINALRSGKFGEWLSEREWIPIMLETADKPRRLVLKADVDGAGHQYRLGLNGSPCDWRSSLSASLRLPESAIATFAGAG